MILPDFILPSRVNQHWQYSGIDSIEKCMKKSWFKQYPHNIEYHYNNRGFRDNKWPESLEELKNAIWCIGDSFTVGLGSPIEHTWPCILQQKTGIRTINVSMDGASNNWISRKATSILGDIKPSHMVIHWSYIERREESIEIAIEKVWNTFYSDIRDPSWPDCTSSADIKNLPKFILDEIDNIHSGIPATTDERRILQSCNCSPDEDIENTLRCIRSVNQYSNSTKIIHSFIPRFTPVELKGVVELHTKKITPLVIPEFLQLDWARDYHHYDIKTSQEFVKQIVDLLNFV